MRSRSNILATLLVGWALGALLVPKLSLLGLAAAAVFIVAAMYTFELRHHHQLGQTPLVARSFYYLWFFLVILLPRLMVVLLVIFDKMQHALKKQQRKVIVPCPSRSGSWSHRD